jgi:N-acetylmuramoyl-L-alanine amidase
VCPDGFTEAELNQDIATRVQKQLIEQGIDVILLKEFDLNLTGFKAAALVSIHADSCGYINDEARGYKVAASLANKNPEFSTRLTACIRLRYAQATNMPLHSSSVTPDMTSYHAFSEIDDSTPAAIIETGFMNLDRDYLTHNANAVAQGITQGVLCFLNNESLTQETSTAAP